MTDYKILYEDLKTEIKKEIPKFQIKYKNEDTLQKLIGFLLFFNKGYMTSFTTTMFSTVYYPDREFETKNYEARFHTLAHEFVHLYDMKKHWWFSLSYLYPQILGVLSLLSFFAFVNLWFLLFLGFLIFLAPLPSSFRTKWEVRGYSMNLMLNKIFHGNTTKEEKDRIIYQFTSNNYYKMCSDAEAVSHLLDIHLKENLSFFAERPYTTLKILTKF